MLSLDGLPLVVLRLLCAHLCRHCRQMPVLALINRYDDGEIKASIAALKALSETSHTLRDIAQPILCHAPNIHDHGRFVQTMVARPDLAAQVRCLPGRRWWRTQAFCEFPDDLALSKRVAKSLCLEDPLDPDYDDMCGVTDGLEHFFAQINLSMLPRVELFYCVIHADDEEDPDWYPVSFAMLMSRLESATVLFPNLRTLVVDGADHESGFTMGYVGLASFVAAAPNLTRLVLCRVSGINLPSSEDAHALYSLPSSLKLVRELVLEDFLLHLERHQLDYGALSELLRVLPALQALTLRPVPFSGSPWSDYHRLSPVRLLGALSPARETLTSITLCLSRVRVAHEELR